MHAHLRRLFQGIVRLFSSSTISLPPHRCGGRGPPRPRRPWVRPSPRTRSRPLVRVFPFSLVSNLIWIQLVLAPGGVSATSLLEPVRRASVISQATSGRHLPVLCRNSSNFIELFDGVLIVSFFRFLVSVLRVLLEVLLDRLVAFLLSTFALLNCVLPGVAVF